MRNTLSLRLPLVAVVLPAACHLALNFTSEGPFAEQLVAYPDHPNHHDLCPDYTSGTCHIFSCYESRGPVDCHWGSCVCKPGYCVDVSDPGRCIPADRSTLTPVPGSFLIAGARAPNLNLYLSKFGSFGLASGDPGPQGHFKLLQVPEEYMMGAIEMHRPMAFLLTTERWPNYFLQLSYVCSQICADTSQSCSTDSDGKQSCTDTCNRYETVCNHQFASGQMYVPSNDFVFLIAEANNPQQPPDGDIASAITSGPQLLYGMGQRMYIGVIDTQESSWYSRDPTTFTPFQDVYSGAYLLFTSFKGSYASVYLESLKADVLWMPSAALDGLQKYPLVSAASIASASLVVFFLGRIRFGRSKMLRSSSSEVSAALLAS